VPAPVALAAPAPVRAGWPAPEAAVLSLPIETVVTAARPLGPTGAALPDEHRAIVDRCVTPSAIAEVSAHLRLPLGVARVLVADLVDDGWLTASQTAGDQPEIDLVERLISGLRALA
jgi:hypothetical protein